MSHCRWFAINVTAQLALHQRGIGGRASASIFEVKHSYHVRRRRVMKHIRLLTIGAVTLALILSAYAQTRKSIDVTPKMIATQPADKPYVIDLSGDGTTYTVAASVANRVRIRTAKGETELTHTLKELGLTGSKYLIGTAAGLRAVNFGQRRSPNNSNIAARSTRFGCGLADVCWCNPKSTTDCFALSRAECRDSILYCTDKICYCVKSN